MNRTVTGTLRVGPRDKVSHSGNKYAELLVESKEGKHYKCLIFREQADRAMKELKESLGAQLVLYGKVEPRGEDPDHFTLLAETWGYADNDEQKKAVKRRKEKLEVDGQYVSMMEGRGLVRAKVSKGLWGWEPKDECVQIKGTWVKKIYFILSMLGPETVNMAMKEAGVNIMENLKFWPDLKQDLLGCALTDWEQGVKPRWGGADENRRN